MISQFPRIQSLPSYTVNTMTTLKSKAHACDSIIDFNPDGVTSKHIVDKLIKKLQRTDTHRYLISKSILRLRKALRCLKALFKRAKCR